MGELLLPILVTAIVGFIIGMIWYAPPVFGKKWAKLQGFKGDMKPHPAYFLAGFINTIIMTAVLALFIQFTGATDVVSGMMIGFLVWVGFIATTLFSGVLWQKRHVALYWIDALHYLIVVLVNASILAVWL